LSETAIPAMGVQYRPEARNRSVNFMHYDVTCQGPRNPGETDVVRGKIDRRHPFGKYDFRGGAQRIEHETMHLLLVYIYQIQSHRHNRSLLYTKGRSKISREEKNLEHGVLSEDCRVSKAGVIVDNSTYLVTKILSHITDDQNRKELVI
jgi:hypothetical protein